MNALFDRQWQALLAQRPDCAALTAQVRQQFEEVYARRHRQFDVWLAAIETLALPEQWQQTLDAPIIAAQAAGLDEAAIAECARLLMPWRKGPFQLSGLALDCEWRSDMSAYWMPDWM